MVVGVGVVDVVPLPPFLQNPPPPHPLLVVGVVVVVVVVAVVGFVKFPVVGRFLLATLLLLMVVLK